jgi:AAA+ ATPase superfamily predicted ATPase
LIYAQFLKSKFTGSMKDKLFADYANNLKMMIQNANLKQEKLLQIINE